MSPLINVLIMIIMIWIGELQEGHQDQASLPPELILTPHNTKVVVEVKASGLPHVLGLRVTVSKDMQPAKHLRSNKSSFPVSVKRHGNHKSVTR